jgi:archaellum biogenesis ATPase FlaH
MIHDQTRDDFVKILQTYLSPTSPIQSQEYLYGREAQIRKIEQALYASGRSVFIYGDRGVGKTSLAQTAAYCHQSADGDPVIMACDAGTTFLSLMNNVAQELASPGYLKTITQTAKVDLGAVSYEVSEKRESRNHPHPEIDLNVVVRTMKAISNEHPGPTVVIVDEFDRISSEQERIHFADFIKQIGDQRIGIHFIFCGVADSLDQLLGSHDSCYRYLESVELPRLGWEPRWQIIDNAAEALNISVGNRARYRIAAISDGFPHYVHLICEKLFWQIFDDETYCTSPTPQHYEDAIGEAVIGIEQRLKKAYEKATIKDSDDYEEILWAMADNSDLIRNTSEIYQSYCAIVGTDSDGIATMDRPTFTSRLQSLKSASCGHILSSKRRGWYQFTENIIRGYVRLRAEEAGLELALDTQSDSRSTNSGPQHTTRKAKLRGLRFSPEQGWYRRSRPK